jgi:hypothetical protein
MLFETVKIGDIIFYCEQNNLMLIDDMCTEDIINYGMNLFVGGLILGCAGMLLVISVLIAPQLPQSL